MKRKWADQTPSPKSLSRTLSSCPADLRVVFFATKREETLLSDLIKIRSLAGDDLNGLQIDLAWPNPQLIEQYKETDPETAVILRLGSQAVEMTKANPREITTRVQPYVGLVDTILIKPTNEISIPFVESLFSMIKEQSWGTDLGLGVITEISPNALSALKPLAKIPKLSISGYSRPKTELNPDTIKNYLAQAAAIFG